MPPAPRRSTISYGPRRAPVTRRRCEPPKQRGRLTAEERDQQRENDTQEDRRRERKIEREVPALHVNVPGQTKERQADHHREPQTGDREADEDQRFGHRIKSIQSRRKSSRFRTPRCPARRIRASRCARSTARIPCAACRCPPLRD